MELAGVSDASGKASQSRIGAIIWALIFNGTLSLLTCVELCQVLG
jgi:hypothetical protein